MNTHFCHCWKFVLLLAIATLLVVLPEARSQDQPAIQPAPVGKLAPRP